MLQKKRERERERSEHVSVGHLQEVKHNGKLQNCLPKKWSSSFMSGSNLQGFDWENFGAVDRWSFMGGGRL